MKKVFGGFCLISAIMAFGEADCKTVPVKVLSWPEGKRAAFTLNFDDGCCSQHKNAIPLMEKYRVCGTFYICSGWSQFTKCTNHWATTSEYVTLGNHSHTHGNLGAREKLHQEIGMCNEAIRSVSSDKRWPRLVAFAVPGAETIRKHISTNETELTEAELDEIEKKYNLRFRSQYWGYPEGCVPPLKGFKFKPLTTYVTSVLDGGGYGHLDFHGVGGDWLDPGIEYFEYLLQELDKNREFFWFAPWIDIYKYMTLREEAEVMAYVNDDGETVVEVASSLDPFLYDVPLWVKVNGQYAPVVIGKNIVGQKNRREISSTTWSKVTPQTAVWDKEYGKTSDMKDFAFEFRVIRYADGVGVKAIVYDDKVVTDNCKAGTVSCPSWDVDTLECFFDGDNNKANDSRSGNELDFGGEFTIVANGAAQSDFSGQPKSFGKKWTGDIKKTLLADGTYRLDYDMWFSWECLGRKTPPKENESITFGFNICIHDDDDGGRNDHAPYWKGNPNIPYRDESAFGTITLQGDPTPKKWGIR